METKSVKDYYEIMYKKYPEIPKQDIRRILNYYWRAYYLHNSYGGDVIIKDSEFWCYSGRARKDSVEWFQYYCTKLATKIRILYKRKKIPWDGYYYFALTDNQQKLVDDQKKVRGRKRKHFNYGNVMLYRILDECSISNTGKTHIYRIPYISELKYKFYKPQFTTDKAELILVRNPLKFTDVLTFYNDYEVL